jgi:CubicO group peptidase (beta-lactamase class C family)
MTSGLAGNDADDSSPGNELKMFAQTAQPDYYKFALDLPMAREPGGDRLVYFTAGIDLLGGIVRNTMGMSMPDFFETYFARPLDIHTYHLNLTPRGEVYCGGGLYMRPRDGCAA